MQYYNVSHLGLTSLAPCTTQTLRVTTYSNPPSLDKAPGVGLGYTRKSDFAFDVRPKLLIRIPHVPLGASHPRDIIPHTRDNYYTNLGLTLR